MNRSSHHGDLTTLESTRLDAGDRWLQRVARAADRVLGNSVAGREVSQLCQDHADARDRLMTDRAADQTIVAVVGATGQGKSWLVRQLIRRGPAASIRSGNALDEATEKLTWVGPRPPTDLDPRHETFLACPADRMQPIGTAYLIVDAPGATDDRASIAAIAQRALSTATVLLVVIRRDQLRSQRVSGLAMAAEGAIIVPVVNVVPRQDDALAADTESLLARLRATSPQSVFMPAVIVRDFELGGADADAVGAKAAEDVASRITQALQENGEGQTRRSVRLAALDARFTAAVASVLESELPELTAAVKRLETEARQLPGEIAQSLLGGGAALRAAVRSRLRVGLLTETAALFFPYRTLLSTLNLTHGAWDRVMLSLAGSLPSLLSAVYAGAKNLGNDRASQQELRDGLRQRTAAAVADRLGPMARRFRRELVSLQRGHAAPGSRGERVSAPESWHDVDSPASLESEGAAPVAIATLTGLDTLQTSSQTEFEQAVDRGAMPAVAALMAGLIGTAMFWAFLSGPLVGLYRDYLTASALTLREVTGDASAHGQLDAFPRPEASFLLTSLLLSMLPTAVFAMVVLSVAQARSRVERIETDIRHRHDAMITRLQKEGVLRLAWNDRLLADAEFLLSIGPTETNR